MGRTKKRMSMAMPTRAPMRGISSCTSLPREPITTGTPVTVTRLVGNLAAATSLRTALTRVSVDPWSSSRPGRTKTAIVLTAGTTKCHSGRGLPELSYTTVLTKLGLDRVGRPAGSLFRYQRRVAEVERGHHCLTRCGHLIRRVTGLASLLFGQVLQAVSSAGKGGQQVLSGDGYLVEQCCRSVHRCHVTKLRKLAFETQQGEQLVVVGQQLSGVVLVDNRTTTGSPPN